MTLVLSMSANTVVLSIARLLSGFAGAVAFVAASALAANIAQAYPGRLGFLMGLLYTGPAIGIFISGLTAPFLLEALGPGSWWIVWGVLAAIAVVLTCGAAAGACGARPRFGWPDGGKRRDPADADLSWSAISSMAMGSIAYMTFMIAFVRDAGGGALLQSAFWTLIALGAFVSPSLWGGVIGRSRGGGATAIVTAVTGFGALIPFFASSPAALAISAAVFGCSLLRCHLLDDSVRALQLSAAGLAEGDRRAHHGVRHRLDAGADRHRRSVGCQRKPGRDAGDRGRLAGGRCGDRSVPKAARERRSPGQPGDVIAPQAMRSPELPAGSVL